MGRQYVRAIGTSMGVYRPASKGSTMKYERSVEILMTSMLELIAGLLSRPATYNGVRSRVPRGALAAHGRFTPFYGPSITRAHFRVAKVMKMRPRPHPNLAGERRRPLLARAG